MPAKRRRLRPVTPPRVPSLDHLIPPEGVPSNPDAADRYADAAAEAIRGLNHSVQHVDEFSVPDVYRVVAGIGSAASRLVTAIGHLESILASRGDHLAQLRADDGSDPVDALVASQSALIDAGQLAHRLGVRLNDAQQQIAKIADSHHDED